MTAGSSRVEQASGQDVSNLVLNWRLCCSKLTLSYIVAQIFLSLLFFSVQNGDGDAYLQGCFMDFNRI